jgi:hypothetical protein
MFRGTRTPASPQKKKHCVYVRMYVILHTSLVLMLIYCIKRCIFNAFPIIRIENTFKGINRSKAMYQVRCSACTAVSTFQTNYVFRFEAKHLTSWITITFPSQFPLHKAITFCGNPFSSFSYLNYFNHARISVQNVVITAVALVRSQFLRAEHEVREEGSNEYRIGKKQVEGEAMLPWSRW